MQFKHLQIGDWFHFVNQSPVPGPWQKKSARRYTKEGMPVHSVHVGVEVTRAPAPVTPRLKDAFEKFKEAFKQVFHQDDAVALVEDADGNYLNIEGILVFECEVEKEKRCLHMDHSEKVKVPGWLTQVVTYDPGVRYYKDGSGQPPSEDVEDVGTDERIWQCIRRVLKMVSNQRIDAYVEGASYEEMYKEQQAAEEADYREQEAAEARRMERKNQ
jgi:hypothetical protein